MIEIIGQQLGPNIYQYGIEDDPDPPEPPPGSGGSSGNGVRVGAAQIANAPTENLSYLEIRPGEQAETGDQSFGRNSDGDTFELSAEARELIGG